MDKTHRRGFWYLTFTDILALICAAAVPIALGIYTLITYKQEQEQAQKTRQFAMNQAIGLRQDTIYDKFLENVYDLDKDGYLNESKNPWAFANAYYRAVHRHLNTERKGEVLLFLKEKKLIGRHNCTEECKPNNITDIIRLNELNFNNIHLKSQLVGNYKLKLDCILFNQVSMTNAIFSSVSLNGASFDHGRLDNTKFENSSLACASFNGTHLRGTDLRTSNIKGAHFSNTDLSETLLTEEQYGQVTFYNTTLKNGTVAGEILL